MSLKTFVFGGFLSAFLLGSLAYGQGQVGTLNGTVLDQSAAVIPGAAVVATNNATKVDYTATSTSTGTYTIPYVPSGTYTVRVSSPGFRSTAAENVILRVAQTLTLDVKLEIGGVNDQIVVSDRAQLLDADSAEMGKYITTEEYKEWPIFVSDGQRQIQQFIFDSLPGTTGDTFQGSINGGQQYSHEILIEGMPLGRSDLSGGNNNEMSPSSEAIGEMKLQTGAVGAEYNGGQTAVANYTIKSGTNDPHGSLFYYLQNEALNAQDIQSKTSGAKAPRNRLNNYGYSFGGPVYIPKVYKGRNKTFFFTNFEKTKQDNFVFSGFATLPATPFRTGDFSGLLNPAFTGKALSGTQIGTDALQRPIVYGQIYDPRTTRTLSSGAVVRDPFPNNQIPQSLWDPVAKNILGQYGYPSTTLNSMVRNIPQLGTCCPFFNEHIIGVKIDHEINEKNRLSGYYNGGWRQRNNNSDQRYLPVALSPSNSWTDQSTPSIMGRLSLVTTISTSLVNRIAGGYNSFVNRNGTPVTFVNQDYASKLGLQNLPGTVFPRVTFSGSEWQGGTIAGLGAGGADRSVNGSYIFQDGLTWIRGSHTFRFGYEYKRYFFNDNALSDAGTFRFNALQTGLPASAAGAAVDVNQATGSAFASFLLGAAQSAQHNIVGLSNGFRQPQHAAYVMDDWKITPKLTANLGFRWEVIPPLYEVTGRMSEIDLSTPDPGAGNRPGALVFKNQVNDTYWRSFGPRLGLAYRVNNNMVVRGGYGILSTPPISNGWGYGGFLYGFNGTVNVPAQGAINNPALYLANPFPSLPGALPNKNPSSADFTSATTTARDANRPGYTQNWNFTIQYQLPAQTVIEVAYVGNKGTRMWGGAVSNELDALPASRLSLGSILNDPVSAHPEYLPYVGFPTTNTVAQALRPYPQYYSVQERFPYNTNSNYHSLQTTVTRHVTTNLGFLFAYTWSKSIDYQDSLGPASGGNPQDYFNRGLERSVASFNQPHNFKLTWVYETPFGKGRRFDLHWANPIVGGWQLAAIHNYATGFPIAIGESGVNVPSGFGGGIRPDVTGVASALAGGVPSHVDTTIGSPFLKPAAFAPSPTTSNGTPLRVGTAPRFLPDVRGPAQYNETLRMSKRFVMWSEKSFFQVGATLSNPFKRLTPYIVDTTVGDSAFGTVLQGGGGRTLQLEGRFEF